MDINKDAKKGNSFGSDIKKGKKTIMMIKALELSDKTDYLNSLMGKDELTDGEVVEVTEIFRECGAISYAESLAISKIKNAKERINSISEYLDEDYVKFFLDIADYVIKRRI
jgi:geranylgeranyl diphosphate synthase type I